MKTTRMSRDEIMTQLEALGSENTRKIYARHGAGNNQFGVTLTHLRGLAKKLKTNHPLALELWATGNTDARMLATMLMAPAQLSLREIEDMLKPLTYYKLVDEFVANVLAHSPRAAELRARWADAPEELVGRAGWSLWFGEFLQGENHGHDLDALLKRLESEILAAPKRKQEAMNRCLVEIGVHFPDYRPKCLAIGERLGRFDQTPVPKGCVSSYAPEWIAAVLARKKK